MGKYYLYKLTTKPGANAMAITNFYQSTDSPRKFYGKILQAMDDKDFRAATYSHDPAYNGIWQYVLDARCNNNDIEPFVIEIVDTFDYPLSDVELGLLRRSIKLPPASIPTISSHKYHKGVWLYHFYGYDLEQNGRGKLPDFVKLTERIKGVDHIGYWKKGQYFESAEACAAALGISKAAVSTALNGTHNCKFGKLYYDEPVQW